ncbi:MAG: hypothetical protein JSW20_08155 [Nitrospiraceae bacterium]|nr:MAG: hypothetical protein JSW20_08155 [Nitrospiraceae bacterium]
MKKMKKGKKKTGARLWYSAIILLLAYALSAGASYFFLKDKFAFESTFITEIEARQALHEHKKKLRKTGRLYKTRESIPLVKSGTMSRKDRMLVLAEDTIKKMVEENDVKLLDLYLDRNGVIYMDFSDELKKNYDMDIAQELTFLAALFNGIRSSVPGLTAMKILIEGREVDSLGGHIDISIPIGEEIAGII